MSTPEQKEYSTYLKEGMHLTDVFGTPLSEENDQIRERVVELIRKVNNKQLLLEVEKLIGEKDIPTET